MSFARFMATPVGRILRILAGGVMIFLGLAVVGGTEGLVLAGAGLLPVAAGALNFCAISKLIGAPFWGRATLGS